MVVPSRFPEKSRPLFPEAMDVELLPSAQADCRKTLIEVGKTIYMMTKYVLFFCCGMVVGAVFLSYGDVRKRCFESMLSIGFNHVRAKNICTKYQEVSQATKLRFDCMPRNANSVGCKKIGCIWDGTVPGSPY